jgi:hypothetical protein
MVDHLMNSTRRVLILAPHTDDAELEDAGNPSRVLSVFAAKLSSTVWGIHWKFVCCGRADELRLSGDEAIVMPRIRPRLPAQPPTFGMR